VAVVLLDSVSIVAFLDGSNVFHTVADNAVSHAARSGRLLASVVSFAELLTGVELGHHDEGVVRGFFAQLIDEVLPVDTDVAERAAALRGQRKSLRMPDALILATADLHAQRVITADHQWPTLTTACAIEVMATTGDAGPVEPD
jgi:predicted nucleic acid-binding protein